MYRMFYIVYCTVVNGSSLGDGVLYEISRSDSNVARSYAMKIWTFSQNKDFEYLW